MAELKTLTINDVTYEITDDDAVKFIEQSLTEEQKIQARENIGAASSEEVSQLSEEKVGVTPQTFTEEQKAQARENLGIAASTEGGLSVDFVQALLAVFEKTAFLEDATEELKALAESGGVPMEQVEVLGYTRLQSYPDTTTFEIVEATTGVTFTLAGPSTLSGGTLSVELDTNVVYGLQCNLYVFDADGNPYLHSESDTVFNGETEPKWYIPGKGAGFGKVTAPFTVSIPDGCTVMVLFTNYKGAATFPDGSITTHAALQNWILSGGVKCTITK